MIYSLGDKKIQTSDDEYYVAPGACVIGNVRFGVGASVWFNCVIRGDSDWIIIGDGSSFLGVYVFDSWGNCVARDDTSFSSATMGSNSCCCKSARS